MFKSSFGVEHRKEEYLEDFENFQLGSCKLKNSKIISTYFLFTVNDEKYFYANYQVTPNVSNDIINLRYALKFL